jgi:cellulose synthase/poly-beta-1,6-N-acetylglucosamine synthase-like glycosyltransferase
MSLVFFSILFLFCAIYCILIISFSFGWYKKPSVTKHPQNDLPYLSVIIAVRNEAGNIPDLLKHLKLQDYPSEKFEVIFSDDHSDDQTFQLLKKLTAEIPDFNCIAAPAGSHYGKKEAIDRALKIARCSIIIFTDADCRMNPQWLLHFGNEFRDENLQMLLAPVDIQIKKKGIFSAFQSLEFMSLQGVTAGSANINKPVVANAANMACRKSTMEDVKKNMGGKKYLSGDDMFLLHAIKKIYPENIKYSKDLRAFVETGAAQSSKTFLRQRARWSSKSVAYKDFFTLFTGAAVAGLNILIVTGILTGLLFPYLLFTTLIIWGIKTLIDFPLIYGVTGFFGKRYLLWLYIPLQVIYPFSVSITLFHAIFASVKWKERNQK